MAITATALLQIPDLPAPAGMRAELLTDATLLHTGAPFASEPEELFALLEAVLGPVLAQHGDPRGVLFLPDVAKPEARSYAEVVAEVGEGGVWAAPPEDDAAFALPDGLGALSAALGSMVQNMPPSVLAAAEAAARGDAAAFRSVGEQVAAMLGQPDAQLAGLASMLGQPDAQLAGLASMLGISGIDALSPAMEQIIPKLEQEFARDPQKLQQLAAQLFGAGALPSEDDDE
jgi:hypothetical protein